MFPQWFDGCGCYPNLITAFPFSQLTNLKVKSDSPSPLSHLSVFVFTDVIQGAEELLKFIAASINLKLQLFNIKSRKLPSCDCMGDCYSKQAL